jgi:hypothetical protein
VDAANDLVQRYSEERVRSSFEYFRTQSGIQSPGAWLYSAIVGGWTHEPENPTYTPSHKEIVGEDVRDACVREGMDPSRFHQCPPDESGKRYMYFAEGGPTKRSCQRAG